MKSCLFVFDLDFTLWNCGDTWCDHSTPPYRRYEGRILDARGEEMVLYPDVIHILEEAFHSGAGMALASRTARPDWAEDLLKLHGILPYFEYREIYPGSKVNHFHELHKKSGYAYERMIFFDDEPRNIQEVGALGVNSVLVNRGLDYQLYKASVRTLTCTEPAL